MAEINGVPEGVPEGVIFVIKDRQVLEDPNITLTPEDAALVFRADGTMEIRLPLDDAALVTDTSYLISALAWGFSGGLPHFGIMELLDDFGLHLDHKMAQKYR